MPRITSQRKIVLDYLRSVRTHPSAEEVFLAVKKILPQISLGTVYRNLETLKGEGTIIEIPGELKRFDGDLSFHGHFKCQSCGLIIDISKKDGDLNQLWSALLNIRRIKKIRGNKINSSQIFFYGLCKSCKRKTLNLPRQRRGSYL